MFDVSSDFMNLQYRAVKYYTLIYEFIHNFCLKLLTLFDLRFVIVANSSDITYVSNFSN